MRIWIITAALAAATAMTVPAPARNGPDHFSVRNDGGTTLNCRVRRPGRSSYQRVLLRPGEEWRESARPDATRTLYCDPPAAALRYRLRPGVRYRFVPSERSVALVLRVL